MPLDIGLHEIAQHFRCVAVFGHASPLERFAEFLFNTDTKASVFTRHNNSLAHGYTVVYPKCTLPCPPPGRRGLYVPADQIEGIALKVRQTTIRKHKAETLPLRAVAAPIVFPMMKRAPAPASGQSTWPR